MASIPPPPPFTALAAAVLMVLLPFASATLSLASNVKGMVGVTYNMNTPGLPPPTKVAKALVAAGVTRVLLIDPWPEGIAAFNESGIALTIAISNSVVRDMGSSAALCSGWIRGNFIELDIKLEAISIGFNVLSEHQDLVDYLLPAMTNLHKAMDLINPDLRIAISTINSYDLISPVFPPSAAEFKFSSSGASVKALLEFLDQHGFPLFISLYPFKIYRAGDVPGVDAGIATLDSYRNEPLVDPGTGLLYHNLFDAMVDATASAMAKLGFPGISVTVSGTGWPSGGGLSEPEESALYAGEYNVGLVAKLNRKLGTPARPGITPVTFIDTLFDDPSITDWNSGSGWGIWTPDLQQKYVIDYTPSDYETSGAVPRPLPRVYTAVAVAVAAAAAAAALLA